MNIELSAYPECSFTIPMRFVSKNSNLRVILQPGLPAQPLSGFPGKPTIAVKFENGVAEVKDPEMLNMMLNHPGLLRDGDFIAIEAEALDPFIDLREEKEPVHVISNIKYGHIDGTVATANRKNKVNPELKKLVNDLAMKQIQEMLPGLVAQGVKDVLASLKADMPETTAPSAEETEEEQDFTEEEVNELAAEMLQTESEKAPKAKKSPKKK